MVCALRGSVCVYQGEELGLPEAEVPFELLQDPYGIAFWPNFKGRDGCRTPMPWSDAESGGFTRAQPWLPIPEVHRTRSVEHQHREADSPLQRFRTFMRWRRAQPALVHGEVHMLSAPEPVLALERSFDGRRLRAWFNTGDRAMQFERSDGLALRAVNGHGLVGGELDASHIRLPAYGVLFAEG
jgi:alpha-glucosidase